jgi:hypothetical protein
VSASETERQIDILDRRVEISTRRDDDARF